MPITTYTALTLSNLQAGFPIVDPLTGKPTPYFTRLINDNNRNNVLAVTGIQSALDAAGIAQAAAVTANAAAATANAAAMTVTAASSLANSYTTGLVLTASDAGASATISITAHTRIYGDGTSKAITAGSVTGLAYSTDYRVYYDDPTRAGGVVAFIATTSITTAAQAGDRHSVGAVKTPAALGVAIGGNPVFPPGFSYP
jgi:hypothetical protein